MIGNATIADAEDTELTRKIQTILNAVVMIPMSWSMSPRQFYPIVIRLR